MFVMLPEARSFFTGSISKSATGIWYPTRTGHNWSGVILCLKQFKSCCCCILLFKSGDMKETSDPDQITETYIGLNTRR